MKTILLVYIFLLPLYPMFSKIYIGGYPLVTWYTLFVLAISLVYSAVYTIKHKIKGMQIDILILLMSFIVTVGYSVVTGWGFAKVITNATTFYLPFFICVYALFCKVTLEEIIKVSMIGTVGGGVISLLIAVGILSSGMNTGVAATDSLLYNFNYVDGSAGIFAIIVSLYFLMSKKEGYKISCVVSAITGLVIVVFNQSRGYIVCCIAVLLVMGYLIVRNIERQKRVKLLFRMVVIVLFIVAVVAITDNPVKDYLSRIMLRLHSTSLDEINVTYRFSEISEYMELFKENPLFGTGWGLINNETQISAYTTRYRAHNMYAGVLACTGLTFTPIFIITLLRLLLKSWRKSFKYQKKEHSLAVVCVLSVLILGIANAGFENDFCVVFTIIPFILNSKEVSSEGEKLCGEKVRVK